MSLHDKAGRVEQRQFVGGDFVVELVVGEEAPAQVDLGINRDGFFALRKAAELGDGGLVVFLNVLARAGDGQFVEELEEGGVELLQQFAGLALVGLLLRP